MVFTEPSLSNIKHTDDTDIVMYIELVSLFNRRLLQNITKSI